MKISDTKPITNKDWSVIIRTDSTEAAYDAMEAEFGEARFKPQKLIKDWCDEVLRPKDWATTRPYFNKAKLLTNFYPKIVVKNPPMYFYFNNRSDATLMKEEFGHLFEMTEVNSNRYDGDNSVI